MRPLLIILLLAIITVSSAFEMNKEPGRLHRRSTFVLRPWRKGWDAFFGPDRLPLPHGGWGWGKR